MSLEDIVKSLATNTLQFQQETKQFQQEAKANIQSLDNQIGQMATVISRLEVQSSGKLPSQTIVNPRENASAIVLRSGKEVEIPVKATLALLKQENEQNVVANKDVPNDDEVPKPDRSIAYPKGVVEDVLVQVNDLVFPADFYVLDMENGDQTIPILLGRPFLKTSKTKIDVHSGTLTMEFDGEIVKFNIYDAMKYPDDDNPIYSIDVIDSLAQEVFELDGKDGLEVAISKHLEKENEELALSTDLQETVATLNDSKAQKDKIKSDAKYFV
nr:hypothetical protein CFP56_40322 [Quercus suber]